MRPGAVRPTVAKFYRYSDRERVRQLGYDRRNALKGDNQAVRPQLPSEVLENRKPLYPALEKAKADGAKVKFVLDKLYITGKSTYPLKAPMQLEKLIRGVVRSKLYQFFPGMSGN